jgi:hypothetical protein
MCHDGQHSISELLRLTPGWLPDGSNLAMDRLSPAVDGVNLALDGLSPAVDRSSPSPGRSNPAADESNPSMDGSNPAVDGLSPAVDIHVDGSSRRPSVFCLEQVFGIMGGLEEDFAEVINS